MASFKRWHTLNDFQRAVLHEAATEAPGSGAYESCKDSGIYLCKQCDAPLFLSSHKFSSGCGWPSFDDELPLSILRVPDPDGRRVEIQCAFCKGHLGHVFQNEGFTSTMTRHCVNSTSLFFSPTYTSLGYERAFFAGGCFWGLQYIFDRLKGVMSTHSGYMGGWVVNPAYQEVCTGQTGHIESVEVCFDSNQTDFETIAKAFFECHDPFDKGGQGPDRGSQYLSAIFYMSAEQRDVSKRLKKQLEAMGEVVTQIRPAHLFYKAEDYHQHYFDNQGSLTHCHKRVQRF